MIFTPSRNHCLHVTQSIDMDDSLQNSRVFRKSQTLADVPRYNRLAMHQRISKPFVVACFIGVSPLPQKTQKVIDNIRFTNTANEFPHRNLTCGVFVISPLAQFISASNVVKAIVVWAVAVRESVVFVFLHNPIFGHGKAHCSFPDRPEPNGFFALWALKPLRLRFKESLDCHNNLS